VVSDPLFAAAQGITATRTVLVDGPLVFDLGKASRGERPFNFHRGAPLRFGLLPRHGGADDVVWIDAECCFAYHGPFLDACHQQFRLTPSSASQW